jgi:hypothetical protein
VRGEVGRARNAIGLFEVGDELGPAPRVVAECDRVGSRGEDAFGQLRRKPGALGGVLAVYDAEVRPVLLPEGG